MISETIPRLRDDLDLVPSPDPDRPGFLIRDPKQYSEVVLVLPPLMAAGLPFFDGEHNLADLQAHWTRLTGEIIGGEVAQSMISALRENGFLEGEEFEALQEARHREFADASVRLAAHAGAAYPEDEDTVRSYIDEAFAEFTASGSSDNEDRPQTAPSLILPGRADRAGPRTRSGLIVPDSFIGGEDPPPSVGEPMRAGPGIGIAAPHVSPHGGWRSFAKAYADLETSIVDRTVVILGTSHYGEPDRFGLTRKPFETPYGEVPIARELVDELEREGGDAVVMEDYCHAIEHSIEFQVLFLRHRLGPGLRIVPILCGAFLGPLVHGQAPETSSRVERFLEVLRAFQGRHGPSLFWVMGVDLAHIGARYGDPTPAAAETGMMQEVRARDLSRLESLCAGDRDGFLEQVLPNRDDLRWCGLSPLYTFTQAVPEARGQVRSYQQWNIDPESVVTFAALDFHRSSSTIG